MAQILVIDDHPDLLELMQAILESEGHVVETAVDGAAGFAAYAAGRADLVITDIFMPDQDGMETIARLRQADPGARIIAISGGGSGLSGYGYLATAREIGANAILTKPFEREALIQAVNTLLN